MKKKYYFCTRFEKQSNMIEIICIFVGFFVFCIIMMGVAYMEDIKDNRNKVG